MTKIDPKELTNKRKETHGDWIEQSQIACEIKGSMRSGPKWANMPAYRREALDMIAIKLSRIATGDYNEPDHWDDISGYAFLGKGGHDVSGS